jgi:hypothetical protein
MIGRTLLHKISNRLFKKKAIIITGPRQSGKTTLLKRIVSDLNKACTWLNGDEADVREMFENATSTLLKSLIGENKLIVIDEAQRIKNIGLIIKLFVDHFPDIQIIATGSSSFEMADKIKEPLTGRKWEYFLYPLSVKELIDFNGIIEEKRMLEHRMIFGMYPEVVTGLGYEREILKSLADSYLYKDILIWEQIKKPDKLERLIQALAFQIGNPVSYNELSLTTGMDNETVERYIDFLEKAFIVFRLGSLSRNLRNELKKSRKIYFYDTGIRNAVINNFNSLQLRNDTGALWENFIISERMKYRQDNEIYANTYYWRTHAQQEIDYIEEYGGKMYAYEMKWNQGKKSKFPTAFQKGYPESKYMVINPGNYVGWLT